MIQKKIVKQMTNTSTQITKADLDPLEEVNNPNITQTLTPIEPTSEKPFTDEQIKNLNYLTKERGMDTKEAIGLIRSPANWEEFLTEARRGTILNNIDLIAKVQKLIEKKVGEGFPGTAKEGGVLLAILMDKTYGPTSERQGPMFNVAGKQVSIKVGFGFKPYQKK